jgi:hypothetical protein
MYIPFHNLASAGGVVVATMLFRHMCAVMMRKGACEAKHTSFMMQHTYGQVHSLQHCDTTQLQGKSVQNQPRSVYRHGH